MGAYKGIPMALPWWIEVLQQAAEWGTPPWELAGDDNTLLWVLRWRAWKAEIGKAERKNRERRSR